MNDLSRVDSQSTTVPVWDLILQAARGGQRLDLGERHIVSLIDEAATHRDKPELVPTRRNVDSTRITRLLNSELPSEFADEVASPPDLTALKAGVLLLGDSLDEGHRLAQSVEGEGVHAAGDYWHAIMHRREPDYSNSKYWFRRVGRHPIFARLAEKAAERLRATSSSQAEEWASRIGSNESWDPFAFVDLCEHCASAADCQFETAAREIQAVEMRLLLEQTFADAFGR